MGQGEDGEGRERVYRERGSMGGKVDREGIRGEEGAGGSVGVKKGGPSL